MTFDILMEFEEKNHNKLQLLNKVSLNASVLDSKEFIIELSNHKFIISSILQLSASIRKHFSRLVEANIKILKRKFQSEFPLQDMRLLIFILKFLKSLAIFLRLMKSKLQKTEKIIITEIKSPFYISDFLTIDKIESNFFALKKLFQYSKSLFL